MIYKTGDIFLSDSERLGAKIVKFLMTAPTCWHHLYWKITGRLEKERPNYYHAGMVLDKETIIEQQSKVQTKPLKDILNCKKVIIFRKPNLTPEQISLLFRRCDGDMGEGYGIVECLGKTISWITGIKYFAKWFDIKDKAICVVRVAEWYKNIDNFGVSNPNYVTTKVMERYCREKWVVLFEKVNNEVIIPLSQNYN